MGTEVKLVSGRHYINEAAKRKCSWEIESPTIFSEVFCNRIVSNYFIWSHLRRLQSYAKLQSKDNLGRINPKVGRDDRKLVNMKLSLIRSALNPRNMQYYPAAPYSYQFSVVFVGFAIGLPFFDWFERQDENRLTRFRDKSALFGKELGPDDPPSWGDKDYKWPVSQWKHSWWY